MGRDLRHKRLLTKRQSQKPEKVQPSKAPKQKKLPKIKGSDR